MKKVLFFLISAMCLSTQVYADKITASTTLPSNGKPEHVYTMVSGNGAYVSPTTTPVEGDAANGLFAFYAVDGVNGAYYIYSHNAKQWLSYTKAASYSTGVSFIKMSDTKVEGAYFKLDNYSGDNYQISPYTTAGTAQATYLNYFGGVGACSGKTLGLWTDNGSKDGGSRYTFAEYVIVERTYTITVPTGVTLKIAGVEYANGSTVAVEGSLDKATVSVIAPEGKFAVVSVDDVNKTITVNVATLPTLPDVNKYENAWVYPKQQNNVGTANISENNGVYVLNNKVLAAAWMKVGDAIYFAGANAMNLVAGTEPFTVAFGAGDNVAASAMTLKDVKTETLAANPTAIGGAEHFAGVALVANYEYTYKGAKIEIVWRAVLRDGSHYIRTEMELKGVNDVDMFNVIPMIYNVDTQAAGSTPKVVGNTRGATIVSNKIFAGLETPTAYNTVGGASGEEDAWVLKETKPVVPLTKDSWTVVANGLVPPRVTEFTAMSYPNVLAYTMSNVTLKKGQRAEIEVKYTTGNHRLNFGGADLLDTDGNIATSDYKSGFSGDAHENNVFNLTASNDGTYSIRVFVVKSEEIDASSNMTVKIYEAKEGVVINAAVVGIQGRWSRNTTLAAGETWKVGAVVGLIAQDGKQGNANIRETQKRRSFLAYSERERAVPWRAFPCYISWYELNIDRNNAADPTQNMNANQVLDVLNNWKTNFFDKYGEGPAAFIIDDGWDNYGPWTFHAGFPNEMRDISVKAKEMGAGIGAWLGPVGGYGTSGNYRRSYWNSNNRGGMQLSNPAYYQVFLDAAENLVCNQDGQPGYQLGSDNYIFFKYDGISAQPSAIGPDAGDTGNENAEGIIRLERYVRENLREDIFFNTTVGTWASPFWYQITDATWRQEGDYGEIGNNSIDREKWITYRDRLVYQNYVSNSPLCPINTLMTHGFILSNFGAVSKNMTYEAVLREMRCAFLCGSGMVELYNDYALMNSINNGKLWEDLAECIAWQKRNADVLPDAHWVGGNPWNGSSHEVYGWASWNGAKATLALRNGSNSQQTYTFTLREAFEIPANITGEKYILTKSFNVQNALSGLTEGTKIDIDQQLTVTLPASTVYAFDVVNSDPTQFSFEVVDYSPKNTEALETIKVTFNSEAAGEFDPNSMNAMKFKKGTGIASGISNWVINGAELTVSLDTKVTTPGDYTLVIPEGLITRASDGKAYSGELAFTVTAPEAIVIRSVAPNGNEVYSLTTIEVTFNKDIVAAELAAAVVKNAADEVVANTTCTVEGKVLTLTLDEEVTTPGTYTVVIPEGVVKGATIGDAFNGTCEVVVHKFDVYKPRNIGNKTRNDRNINKVSLTNENGTKDYTLTTTDLGLDYVNLADVEEPVNFVAAPGESVTVTVDAAGSWVHFYVFIDEDGDGFTASIAEGSNYAPAGDLVAYSFYNNNSSNDESGWNSVGTVISGNNRNKPSLPAFTVPAEPGKYRMRIKQDWCSIDPQGDADGKFGDFKQNGGQIIDVILEVVGEPVEAGKYYRFKDANGKYLSAGASLATADEADASTIFYFTEDSKLLSYSNGLFLNKVGGFESAGHSGNVAHFKKGTADNTVMIGVAGGVYLSSNGTEIATQGGDWTIEEVTSLPVTVTADKYATFYAPVAVGMPEGVTAHTVTVNTDRSTVTLSEESLASVPANTGVVLYANVDEATTFNLEITNAAAKAAVSGLKGTVAKTLVTKPEGKECYVLGNEDGVGFYRALNGDDDTKFYNAGHKAYLEVAILENADKVSFYGFDFGDETTVIEEIETENVNETVIYDLFGRRIEAITQKGIYIIGGKKQVIK